MVIQNIIPIVMFDVIEFDFFNQMLGDDSINDTYMLEQIQDIGYESHNALKNLGTVALLSFLYMLRIVFYLLIS